MPRGKFIAILGADGVGKSTVIRLLAPKLREPGRDFVFFHWKPVKNGMHRNEIPGDNPHNPRDKKPRNPLASLVFLAYHWLGFWFGYFRFIRPELRRGNTVIADRYAFDMLLDPARFRLNIPAWLLRGSVYTLPRPDTIIGLFAKSETIIARKPELSIGEIEQYQAKLVKITGIKIVDAEAQPEQVSYQIRK